MFGQNDEREITRAWQQLRTRLGMILSVMILSVWTRMAANPTGSEFIVDARSFAVNMHALLGWRG